MKAYTTFGTRQTHQKKPIPNTDQVENSAGGFAWAIDKWSRLDRFLVLGSEGGTYYVNQQELTKRGATSAMECIKSDGLRVVERAVEISTEGRAPKNDPALFVLAMAAGLGDVATKKAALDALPQIARIGTHLFHFLTYVQQFRGWGRSLRDGVGRWYTDKELDSLAYQAIKYRQRDGWSHRDVLRKAHPKSETHNALFYWITKGEKKGELPQLIEAFEKAQSVDNVKTIASLIREQNLPREAIPTHFLNELVVWEALFEKMPMTALIRNLGKMTSIGLLEPMNNNTMKAVETIINQKILQKARIHPLSVLVALKTYEQGKGFRGSLTWQPVREIVDALDEAFYLSFGTVRPTGKRTMLALDVSGSMTSPDIAGMPGISPRIGSAAMALVTANVEKKNHMTTVFSDSGANFSEIGHGSYYGRNGLSTISLSPHQRLDDVIRKISGLSFGGTDCSLPMLYALDQGLKIETFIIYTDSETWAGSIHASQALVKYRRKTGVDAKLVVVGMTSNGFSIADPDDSGMLDVVGFDTATPNIISEFAKQIP